MLVKAESENEAGHDDNATANPEQAADESGDESERNGA